jgi:hypothetical protein
MSPAAVSVGGLDSFRVAVPQTVTVVITRDSLLAAAVPPSGSMVSRIPAGGTVTDRTMLGDVAKVCLVADTAMFRIEGEESEAPGNDGRCAARSVVKGNPAPWIFRVTPRESGDQQLQVRITALLEGRNEIPVYAHGYRVTVRVARGFTFWERLITKLKSLITDTTSLVEAIAALVVALGALYLAIRRFGEKSKDE